MGMSFAGMLMMLLGGGANDLLDVVHTDSYWKAKQVTVSVEQLIADAGAKAPADADPAAPHAAEVRRLMAIRTLGEMKKTEGVAALRQLADAKEPFVADYAKAAIAAIEGKPAVRPGASAKERTTDVWLLPAQMDLVAQAAPAGKPVPGGDIFGEMPLPPGESKEQILEKMTTGLLPIVEKIGNVRLQAVTIGVRADKPAYSVIVARGQYDAKAAAAALGQQQVPMTMVDGVEVFQPDKSVGVILASDTRAVIVTGENNGNLPLEAVVAAIKKDAGDLHDNAEITRLIATVDTTQPIWGVVKMTDGLRQLVPPVMAFDTATLVVSQKDDVASFSLKAQGLDADKVKQSVDELNTHLQEGIAQTQKAVEGFPAVKPMLEALESIKLACEGGNAMATGSMKGSSMSLPMMWFQARASPDVAPAQKVKPAGM